VLIGRSSIDERPVEDYEPTVNAKEDRGHLLKMGLKEYF